MAGLQHYGKTGRLVLNGGTDVVMNCPAWDVIDCYPLAANRTHAGTNLELAGVAGERARRRRRGAHEVVLEMVVIGMVDKDGNLYDHAGNGMVYNQRYLLTNVVNPLLESGSPTISLRWEIPGFEDDGYGYTGLVQADIRFGPVNGTADWKNARCKAALRLTIPAGELTFDYIAEGP